MKTISTSIHESQKLQSFASKFLMTVMTASLHNIMAVSWAVLAATAIITLSVWATGAAINPYVGAGILGLGFIFLALAVDNHGRTARYQMVTGITLLGLALLQNSVSPDFIIVSGVLLASLFARTLFRRLSV